MSSTLDDWPDDDSAGSDELIAGSDDCGSDDCGSDDCGSDDCGCDELDSEEADIDDTEGLELAGADELMAIVELFELLSEDGVSSVAVQALNRPITATQKLALNTD